MNLARVDKKSTLLRHLLMFGLVVLATVLIFGMRAFIDKGVVRGSLSRSLADTSFLLLVFTLGLGPVSRLYPKVAKFITWRRESGIWFTVTGFVHFGLSNRGGFALFREGRELVMFVGYIALLWALVLAFVSSDKAIRSLGSRQWKWLQTMSYSIFYLVVAHAAFHIFWMGESLSLVQYAFVTLSFAVVILQLAAFWNEVDKYKARTNASADEEKRSD